MAGDNDNYDDDYDDSVAFEHLPDHSLSMIQASSYCLRELTRLHVGNEVGEDDDDDSDGADRYSHGASNHTFTGSTAPQGVGEGEGAAHQLTKNGSGRRKQGRQQQQAILDARRQASIAFWEGSSSSTDHDVLQESQIGIIDVSSTNQSGGFNEESTQRLHRAFHESNAPCLVRGLDRTCFRELCEAWQCKEGAAQRHQLAVSSSSPLLTSISQGVNRNWFLKALGGETTVPVRIAPTRSSNEVGASDGQDGLDEDGRAQECETLNMSLREWIELLENLTDEANRKSRDGACDAEMDEGNGNCERPTSITCKGLRDQERHTGDTKPYLKDWHLLQFLDKARAAGDGHDSDLNDHTLYKCPTCIFPHDLLNDFQLRFTQGDYRFCYWGPHASMTGRHSDVLNSYSWSFNVVGTKAWTFYPPSHVVPKQPQVMLKQHPGECMFVPATWQHSVVNQGETISVNHNWITTMNLDLVWQCLQTELRAIDAELKAWGDMPEDSYIESSESMLRGCVGLDVTAFCLMMLVRLLDLLATRQRNGRDDSNQAELESCVAGRTATMQGFERMTLDEFDVIRLRWMLNVLLDNAEMKLNKRIAAVLCSSKRANKIIKLLKMVACTCTGAVSV